MACPTGVMEEEGVSKEVQGKVMEAVWENEDAQRKDQRIKDLEKKVAMLMSKVFKLPSEEDLDGLVIGNSY